MFIWIGGKDLKNGKRNKTGLTNRLMGKGLVFGVLIMLFVAMASVGVAAATDADVGELLISIKSVSPFAIAGLLTVVYLLRMR
jgi:hypothetical protein